MLLVFVDHSRRQPRLPAIPVADVVVMTSASQSKELVSEKGFRTNAPFKHHLGIAATRRWLPPGGQRRCSSAVPPPGVWILMSSCFQFMN